MRIIVTGGAGFIGSAVIRHLLKSDPNYEIANLDCLTYAGNLESLESVETYRNYQHADINICNLNNLKKFFNTFQPDAVMHLAAESHVDRSIDGPKVFLETNIIGTFNLLEATKEYIQIHNKDCLFHHVSTDEVYGDLGTNSSALFHESSKYSPSSPYAASKASSDHLVRSWGRTYNIPYVISNCSNNYGPFQFPEKLIPHMILCSLNGRALNIYGDGQQVRDWLYVDDHAKALIKIVKGGKIGETYNIGGSNEKTNLEVVHMICDLLEDLSPVNGKKENFYRGLINFVKDRPGHDQRYAIDSTKIQQDLNWTPVESFESGLKKTIIWYLENPNWINRILSGEYSMNRRGAIS